MSSTVRSYSCRLATKIKDIHIYIYIIHIYILVCGPGSSVGIATD